LLILIKHFRQTILPQVQDFSSPRATPSRPRILNVRETPNATKMEVTCTTLAADNPSNKLRQRKTPTTVRKSDFSVPSFDQGRARNISVETGDHGSTSCAFNSSTGIQYQNGDNYYIDSVEDMNSSSGSATFLEEDSFGPESHEDSTIHFHFTEDVQEVVV
jgi:hypothetical protein